MTQQLNDLWLEHSVQLYEMVKDRPYLGEITLWDALVYMYAKKVPTGRIPSVK
jgi:hypothetical protein